MAEAKTATDTVTPDVSKRKASRSSKSKIAKVKKSTGANTEVVVTKVVEEKVVEKVSTARTRRMAEKIKTRVDKPAAPVIDDVASMKLTDLDAMEYTEEEFQGMLEMYESTIKDIREGEIVMGKILGVSHDDVIVDVGFKSEGVIPLSEFPEKSNIVVGDEVEVFLEAIEDASGQLLLSKQKADFMRVWENVRELHDAGSLVSGQVQRRIKGGFVVDIMGVDAFLPGSQVALRQVPDFDALVNTEIEVKIIKLNKARRNIVISRRVVLEEHRESLRDTLLQEIAVDQTRKGIVKNITDFGVFIDLGGVDGLLHITDMSWGRVKHPSEMCSLGEEVDVKILDFDEKTSRISLGMKQLTPYPWEDIETKYPIGLKTNGRVVSITDYGAFVELERGIEGLIHISEMSWTQHIKHPSKIMNVADSIEIVVLNVDKASEKISLGIKQLEEDPWKTIADKYPVDKEIKGKVRNLTAFGAFVELEEGIDGLVHISDMSWTRRIQHPSEVMKKGDDISVKILKVDHDNRRISLGFKQLSEDPWPELAKKYSIGSEALGTVIRALDRGLVVELDGSVEGFVPVVQLGMKDGTPQEMFKEGQQIPLSVVEFDQAARRITLSVEAYYKNKDKSEMDAFYAKQTTEAETSGGSMATALGQAGLASDEPEPEAPAEAEAVPPADEPEKPVDEEPL
ncbi:30S ribosomal protein S1 [Gemmatimonas aurantiaca]|nr:30S ribosomal protein S1 [Gemmatimonas aurantiaca]